MASSSSSTCFLCSNRNSIPYFKFSTTLKSPTTLTTNPPPPHFFPRLRLHRVSPNNKNPTTTTDDDDDDDDDDDSLDTTSPLKSPSPFPHFSIHSSFTIWLKTLNRNDWFKFDELGMEMLSIALPAAVALAADPIASLIDTAFVGHIGAVELAAVGVSASVFNLVSKVFNVPLLNITTSFVAEEQALIGKEEDSGRTEENGKFQRKKLLSSVSTSLALAAALGIAETVALSLGSGTLMTIMGAGNFLNVILDPILIFLCGLGISGAAIATVISEFLIAFILLWNLSGKVLLIPFDFDGTKFFSYLKSGGLLIARTLAVFITMTLTTSLAANQGPIPMAGHQICMQVWLSISLLTDALALAGQALLASSYSLGNYEQARLIIYRVIQIGLGAGISLSMILFVGFGPFSTLFSTDSEVLDVARSGILFVAGSQPVNALAFVIDGIYYGVSDFEYAAYSMVVVGLISSIFMLVATPVVGLPGVWTGLFLFMMLRVLAGVWRLSSKSGPWDMVWYKDGAED
ncbi:protein DETOXIFICATION 44, chloroplastic-like isoform X3 [Trifolium pratense]|uniref:protein DETOXIFICATION 44, chloroplastic-like isoform X3 n=1 Tax=Trifolium pratense TaxID=57577 RepID=UPI001E695074|nr:protein DETOXIFICATION 44, chloroplastic-like isoform X3 [Trifolium pratense]